MRAVAYLRVSSASQVDGHSLDAQERLFYELCKNRGWEAVRVYREEGRSAHSESMKKRPVFRQLLDDAGRGQFEIVVVHTLDRWSRNLRVTLDSLGSLARHNVGLVSITENIDYSNPQGRLFTQMLGAFGQYFSDSLATHVSKGIEQRAIEGKHNGCLPFGYESCWHVENGQKKRKCEPEHPGGVHPIPLEAEAVKELFRRYSTGSTTLSQLAAWLNEQGFRTRNVRSLAGPEGTLTTGPRLFTTASVRGILHNPFYAGFVTHRDKLLKGAHEALITRDLFDLVQNSMRRNSGRSETLHPRPERQYLLKGLIRCASCGMPMWAQTYKNGHRYYREHQATRGYAECPAKGGSIPCEVADEQVGRVMAALQLHTDWMDRVLERIKVQDQVERVKKERQQLQEKLRRLGRAYVDGLLDDAHYQREKRLLEMELAELVVPEADAAAEAGRLIEQLPELWAEATEGERRKLLLAVLDAVYVDTRLDKAVVAVKPKAPFLPIFQVAATRDGSEVALLQDPPPVEAEDAGPCLWWRRGRVELPVQKSPREDMLQA